MVPEKKNPTFFQMLIIAVLFGILAGLVSELFYQTYFAVQTDTNTGVNLDTKIISGNLGSKELNAVTANQTSFVKFALKKAENERYTRQDVTAVGIALSEDGWIATSQNARISKNNIAIIGGEIYDIQTVLKDPSTDLVYVKVNSNNVPVVTFSAKSAVSEGQPIVLLKEDNTYGFSVIENTRNIRSNSSGFLSFQHSTNIRMQRVDNAIPGAPIFDARGNLMGIQTGEDTLTPAYQISAILKVVLKKGVIELPSVDLTYEPLAMYIDTEQSGALILNSNVDEVQKNDLITEIEGVKIDKQNSLTDVLLRFSAGDEIHVNLIRNNEEQNIKLKLEGRRG